MKPDPQNEDGPGTNGAEEERERGNTSRDYTASSARLNLWRVPSEFANAIAAAGLGAPAIEADGKIHRFRGPDDRPGCRNCWYLLHLDGIPAGAFGSWKTGEQHTWTAAPGERLSFRQQADIRRLVAQAKAQRDAETRDRHAEAAKRAAAIGSYDGPADPAHPYLQAKQVAPHGLRQQGIALLVPVMVGGSLSSIQHIYPDGSKRFLAGGRISGGFYLIDDATRRPEILIAEGFATAATLHEEIGAACYCAFNAGNLLSVARAVRALHPTAPIILCADNDAWTEGNPGLTKARAAAVDIGSRLLVPDFTGMDLSGKPTDWNDWYHLRHQAQGRAAA